MYYLSFFCKIWGAHLHYGDILLVEASWSSFHLSILNQFKGTKSCMTNASAKIPSLDFTTDMIPKYFSHVKVYHPNKYC